MAGLATLSTSIVMTLGQRKSQVVLIELDNTKGDIVSGAGTKYCAFQYFPETLTDTKAVNYQTKEIPGGSLPLYQWINSGERIISFTAYFSADVDFTVSTSFQTLASQGQISRNVDIRSAIVWLRRYLLPSYGAVQLGVPLTFAPRKLLLYIPNSGIGLSGGDARAATGDDGGGEPQSQDEVLCIMTQCDVTYESFFASGVPNLITVQCSFAQIGQRGGVVSFPQVSKDLDALVNTGSSDIGVYPYPLRIKSIT